jgi:hypothetical protein
MVRRSLLTIAVILSAATLADGCSLAQLGGFTAPTAIAGPVCAVPAGPTGFVGWSTFDVPPGSLTLTWEPSSGVVESYVVELGTTRGASNIGIIAVDSTARSYVFNRLTPGDYFGRVRAKNDCGFSPYSNEANPRVR